MSNYELKPEIQISGEAVGQSGYAAISEELKKKISSIEKDSVVLAIESYPGVNYQELENELFPILNPEETLFVDDYAFSVEEVQEKIKDVITEDRSGVCSLVNRLEGTTVPLIDRRANFKR